MSVVQCFEGPTVREVYYRGKALVSASKSVEVYLPPHASAFNNFTVHVTPKAKNKYYYHPIHVLTSDVEDNKFTILSSEGNVNVDWLVFATRP